MMVGSLYFPIRIKYDPCMLYLSTPPKKNMDTQNHGLKKVTPFENGNSLYLC